jgi:hypothetical protein
MNIGELRSWLKTQPRDQIAIGYDERRALEAAGRAYPDFFDRFIGQVTWGAVMRLDPETLWNDPEDVDLDALTELLKDESYALTMGEWLQSISRLKLTRGLKDDYELFDPGKLSKKLRPIMEGIEGISLEKHLIFKKIVGILESLRDHA